MTLLMLLSGVWLLVASWPLRYPFTDAAEEAQRNETGVGLVVAFIAGAGMMRRRGLLSDLVVLLLGLWLLVSPFVVDYGGEVTPRVAQTNEVVMGIVLIALSVVSMLLYFRSRRTGADEREGG
ncbi:SPW repeat domain-containing protein [Streptomyces macrosporus]|uniref:SPW repeat domain-containing protein n=1 Tax=Streptomyces macrosporus TaxID=44032 RepID=UPI0031DC55B3